MSRQSDDFRNRKMGKLLNKSEDQKGTRVVSEDNEVGENEGDEDG